MTRMGMLVNLDQCYDTRCCGAACKLAHNVALGSHRIKTLTSTSGDYLDVETYFIPIMCQQCGNPSCLLACPHGAISKRSDGVVVVDDAKCSACELKPCKEACPYGAMNIDADTGRANKCDFCIGRIESGEEPACQKACSTNSFIVGDLDDPESYISMALEAFKGKLHQLKPGSGNEPSVYYVLSTKAWHDMDDLRMF